MHVVPWCAPCAAHIPLYLYPFLNTVSKSRPFEYLRLTSLGVIGALVKVDDSDVVNFLLQTEIIPLCLRIMETGSELSKTVATFIVQKILLDEVGLSYICATAERFYAVSTVLSNMVAMLVESPSHRLLKHIARCYLRLADNLRCVGERAGLGCSAGVLRVRVPSSGRCLYASQPCSAECSHAWCSRLSGRETRCATAFQRRCATARSTRWSRMTPAPADG